MPDLRHVPDLVPVKLHYIHIVCPHALASWWAGTALASMRTQEDTVRTDALPFFISAKGLQLISPVGNERQQALHPVRVLLQGPCVRKRLGLRRKRSIRFTVPLASLPSFSCFAGLKEFLGNPCNRRHGSVPLLAIARTRSESDAVRVAR